MSSSKKIIDRFWDRFPTNYRTAEMEQVIQWIVAGESGTVVGLAGVGRMSFLGYLCHRSDVVQNYLAPYDRQVVIVPVDLIDLPKRNLSTLYRTILRSFAEISDRFDTVTQQRVQDCYRHAEQTTDPFLSQSALRELLLYFQARKIGVGLVLLRFESFLSKATIGMTDTIRGLRDSFKETLFYIISLPQEIIYLDRLETIGSLRPIIDNNVCWVGPLNQVDAERMMRFRTQLAKTQLSKSDLEQLYQLSGGLPSLIRVLCNRWLTSENRAIDIADVTTLMRFSSLRHRLSDIWNGLTPAEQSVLLELAQFTYPTIKQKKVDQLIKNDGRLMEQLVKKGVAVQHPTWGANGTLLSHFALEHSGKSRGHVSKNQATGDIYIGQSVVENLEPLQRSILTFLIDQPYLPHTHTEIIEAAWPDDTVRAGVSPDALYHAIREIRKAIEPNSSQPQHVVTWRGQPEGGYKFYPEGKPKLV